MASYEQRLDIFPSQQELPPGPLCNGELRSRSESLQQRSTRQQSNSAMRLEIRAKESEKLNPTERTPKHCPNLQPGYQQEYQVTETTQQEGSSSNDHYINYLYLPQNRNVRSNTNSNASNRNFYNLRSWGTRKP